MAKNDLKELFVTNQLDKINIYALLMELKN
jgi:hypothetical protein